MSEVEALQVFKQTRSVQDEMALLDQLRQGNPIKGKELMDQGN